MRMTNKIMQNNSLYNINNNKVLQDKLSTQMSTQKKLTRPSDDPVVAIRALRLRTSVSELTQFYEKNAPDAESWLKVTEDALGTGAEVLTDMVKQATKAANKDLTTDDLNIILEQMKNLKDEYYSTGNVDYAGRYVFTGYRTDTTLSFTEEIEDMNPQPSYEITEQVTIGDFDTVNYTMRDVLDGISQTNYNNGNYGSTTDTTKVTEQKIDNTDIYRLRLAYDDLAKTTPGISFKQAGSDSASPTISYTDADGKQVELGIAVTVVEDMKQAYSGIRNSSTVTEETGGAGNGAGDTTKKVTVGAVFCTETGEFLFSDAAYAQLEEAITPETEIQVNYTKDSWENGDLRPEHYFACKATTVEDGQPKTVNYNQEYLRGEEESQVIEYDVGYNQTIRVNTTAREAFTHDLDRDIDDLQIMMAQLTEITGTLDELTKVKEGMSETDPNYELITNQVDAAQKAYDYIREGVHELFETTITRMQTHLDDTNIAVTDNGTRSSRLELVSNRLMEQKTTFQTLQSENEDVDITETAIQLTSTELTYEAALMATGKIMQTSLMNYI